MLSDVVKHAGKQLQSPKVSNVFAYLDTVNYNVRLRVNYDGRFGRGNCRVNYL